MHVFVDESERPNRYLMCAVHVASPQIHVVRRSLTDLRLRGQQRVHMTKERPSRRRLILDRIAAMPLRCVMYVCVAPAVRARPACLRRIVTDAAGRSATRLVLEPVESLVAADRVTLFYALQKCDPPRELVYEHIEARAEPMLWAADAIAWAYGSRGDWLRRIAAVIEAEVVVVP